MGVQIQENLREGGEGEEIQENQVVWARVKNWPWWPGVVSPGSRRGKGGRMRKVVMFGRNNQGDEEHADLVSGVLLVFITLIQSFSCRQRKTSNLSVAVRRHRSMRLK